MTYEQPRSNIVHAIASPRSHTTTIFSPHFEIDSRSHIHRRTRRNIPCLGIARFERWREAQIRMKIVFNGSPAHRCHSVTHDSAAFSRNPTILWIPDLTKTEGGIRSRMLSRTFATQYKCYPSVSRGMGFLDLVRLDLQVLQSPSPVCWISGPGSEGEL